VHKDLIRSLELAEHPEGGYFREVFRSPNEVTASGDRIRSALSTIYYLLPAGDCSRWHILDTDEIWHFYAGAPLELFFAEPEGLDLTQARLGPLGEGCDLVQVVPARHWMAARSTGDYTLVGCTMGPGFDVSDFRMLRDDPESATRFREAHRDLASLI